MIIVSHHLLKKTAIDFPQDHVVMRINVAWMKEKQELLDLLGKIQHDIYLDYPQGRSKPPRPTLTLDETIELIPSFNQIKHFAVSNVEEPDDIFAIQTRLPKNVNLVPKIETKKGIENLKNIVEKIKATHIMLDKEDLYIDLDRDSKAFEKYIDLARETCKDNGVNILELQGVVFSPHE